MDVLSTALMWHNLGIACIPILAGSKKPALEAWGQYQTELPTEAKLRAWFSVDYSLAVILGWHNLAVIDFDDEALWQSWQADHDPIDTYRVRTARGWHLYVYCDEAASCWHSEGIDVKAQGGYVLAPPSVHPSGHKYQGYGSPHQIAKIENITDLLPEYEANQSWQPRARAPYDPYDEAMRESCGVSIEAVKAQWDWPNLVQLGGNGNRSIRAMAICPLHHDENASLAIYTDGHAHCFGCGWHGRDCIDMYAALHKLTTAEALKEMAR